MRLYGNLKRFGGEYRLEVATVGEVFRALCSQLRGFRQALAPGHYRVRTGRGALQADRLEEGMRQTLASDEVVHIVPVAAGAKSGIFGVIAGVALIVAGVVTANPYLISAGVGLALGGVALMLTPVPPSTSVADSETSRNTTFSNIDNMLPQGRPVPLAYGEVYTGSLVISQGLYSE